MWSPYKLRRACASSCISKVVLVSSYQESLNSIRRYVADVPVVKLPARPHGQCTSRSTRFALAGFEAEEGPCREGGDDGDDKESGLEGCGCEVQARNLQGWKASQVSAMKCEAYSM